MSVREKYAGYMDLIESAAKTALRDIHAYLTTDMRVGSILGRATRAWDARTWLEEGCGGMIGSLETPQLTAYWSKEVLKGMSKNMPINASLTSRSEVEMRAAVSAITSAQECLKKDVLSGKKSLGQHRYDIERMQKHLTTCAESVKAAQDAADKMMDDVLLGLALEEKAKKEQACVGC